MIYDFDCTISYIDRFEQEESNENDDVLFMDAQFFQFCFSLSYQKYW